MGFNTSSYRDQVVTPSEVRLWQDRVTVDVSDAIFDLGGLNVAMSSTSNPSHVLDVGAMAGDLMTPAMPNGERREISETDLDMLILAYDYTRIPEPGVLGLAAAAFLIGAGRRRRVGQ